MLLINPDLPRVRLELGVLYYRLGSYEVARTYLETALKSPALPADVKGKAEEYLAEIKPSRSRRSLSGEVFLGFRYQSNANLGPAGSSVLLFGQAANLNQAGLGTPDWGGREFGQCSPYATISAIRTRRRSRPSSAPMPTASSSSRPPTSRLLDLTSGPRFQVFNGIFEDVSLKPFVTGGYVWVNDTPYYGSWGGGLESNGLAGQRLAQHIGCRVQAAGQSGHQLSADQQPVSRQFRCLLIQPSSTSSRRR